MVFLDGIAIFITIYFIIRGFFKGLSRDIWSLLAFFIAFFITNYSSVSIQTIIRSNKNLLTINFISNLIGLAISYFVIKKIMKYSFVINFNFLPRSIDGILGGLSGFIKSIIAMVLICGLCNFIDIKEHKILRESTIYSLVNRIYYKINNFGDVKTYLSQLSGNIDYVNNLINLSEGFKMKIGHEENKVEQSIIKIINNLKELPTIDEKMLSILEKISIKNNYEKDNLLIMIKKMNDLYEKNSDYSKKIYISYIQLDILLLTIN